MFFKHALGPAAVFPLSYALFLPAMPFLRQKKRPTSAGLFFFFMIPSARGFGQSDILLYFFQGLPALP